MSDLKMTVEAYKQFHQFLIEFNRMSVLKKNIVIKELEKKIKELESVEVNHE